MHGNDSDDQHGRMGPLIMLQRHHTRYYDLNVQVHLGYEAK